MFELLSAGVFAEVLSVVPSVDAALEEEADGIDVTFSSEPPQPVSRKRESARMQARIAERIFFIVNCSFSRYFSGNTPGNLWYSQISIPGL